MKKVLLLIIMAFLLTSCGTKMVNRKMVYKINSEKVKRERKSVKEFDESTLLSGSSPTKLKKKSGLKAGFADDNKQYNYFIHFLKKYNDKAKHLELDVSKRIIYKFKDISNKPLVNAKISIYDKKDLIKEGHTYSDGSFLFFPSEFGEKNYNYTMKFAYKNSFKNIKIDQNTLNKNEIKIDTQREVKKKIPIDILFIFDTTGSMGEEINRLKKTIELIYLNLSNTKVSPRFGMVLYKDREDEYLTKIIPLTKDIKEFEYKLNKFVSPSGGGDTPEDLQSALKDSIKNIDWREDAIKLSFIITDAAPHLDYNQKYTYINAMKDASKDGIKIFTIGTGGLNIDGEYVLRQISQYTNAKYIFLTYGEKGESKGGKIGSVSHHTGANFQTDKLEVIVIRFVKEEIANILGKKSIEDEYIEAKMVSNEKKEKTLKKLFDMALKQLVDYSSEKLDKNRLSILPISLPKNSKNRSLKLNAEYFSEQLVLNAKNNNSFTLIERKDLQKILKELKLQDSGLIDEKSSVELGKLIGAEYLLVSKLYKKKGKYELFLKLIKVESAEVVSVTKSYIDSALGL